MSVGEPRTPSGPEAFLLARMLHEGAEIMRALGDTEIQVARVQALADQCEEEAVDALRTEVERWVC